MSSVFSISIGGMNTAMQRLQTSAGNIANSSVAGVGDMDQQLVELMAARISFEANAGVAETAARTFDRLLDIKV